MRTHLLRTFYPAPEIEIDTGLASNDECFAADCETGREAATRSSTESTGSRGIANALLEEYELGGYAGI